MKINSLMSIGTGYTAIWKGVKIVGFDRSTEEELRAMLSRIPPEFLTHVKQIKFGGFLGARHGQYDPKTQTVYANPRTFRLQQRFGKGPGWINHAELMIVHEIGHAVFTFLPKEKKDEWVKILGWSKGKQAGNSDPYVERRPGWPAYTSKWTHKLGVEMPRHYSEKNPDECFADHFAFFILNKPFQMSRAARQFLHQLVDDMVQMYPRASVEGPIKP